MDLRKAPVENPSRFMIRSVHLEYQK